MRFRFIYTHEIEGSIISSEPQGWQDIIIGFTRHPDWLGLVEEVKTAFNAYGSNGFDDGARDTFKSWEKKYGPDALITQAVYYAEDDVHYNHLFSGTIPIIMFSETVGPIDHLLQFAIAQQGFWTKFTNHYDTQVDIQSAQDLYGNDVTVLTPEIVTLPSQIINEYSSWNGHAGPHNTIIDMVVATDGPITLSGNQVVNGIMTTEFMRVLVKDQADQTKNGPYNASFTAWTRTTDANTTPEIQNIFCTVLQGSQAGNYHQANETAVLGTDPLTFLITNYVDRNDLMSLGFPSGSAGPNHIEWQAYSQFTDNQIQTDIKDTFSYSADFVGGVHRTPLDPTNVFNIFEIQQLRGDIIFNCNLALSWYFFGTWTANLGTPNHVPHTLEVRTELFQKFNSDPESLVQSNSVIYDPGYTGSEISGNFTSGEIQSNIHVVNYTIPVIPGDIVYLYLKYTLIITYFNEAESPITWNRLTIRGGQRDIVTNFKFESLTGSSQSPGFLLHDLTSAVLSRVSQDNILYSETLGRTNTRSRQYAVSGCNSPYVIFKGLHLRGYTLTDKIFSISAKDIWEGINPITPLAIFYDRINDEDVIRIEENSHVFDDSSFSTLLSNVRQITRAYDQDFYVNSITNGYSKWESATDTGGGVASGLDDPQTKQTRTTLFRNIGKALQILSSFIGASLTIETIRRTISSLSANYKYDNDNIIIHVEDRGGVFSPTLDEKFSSVTGLLNEETRYNKDITPARNFGRWLNYLSGCLQNYLSSVFKFQSGEGNYDMTSTRDADSCNEFYGGTELAESADIQVSDTPLFVPIAYTIIHFLTFDQYKAIQANRHLAIGVSQRDDNHVAFFIKTLEFEVATGQLNLVAWPKVQFDIEVINDNSTEHEDTSLPDTRIFDYTYDITFN